MTITHAGVAVQAADTGRILMIQRTLDPTDAPDVMGTWEFPGGGLAPGETPEQGAWREFSEETGLAQPAGEMTGGWISSDGIYQAFVFTTPTEATAFDELNPDHQAAVSENPDDPGRRAPDVQAWFTRDQIEGLGSALRPEVAEQTDWTQFAEPLMVQASHSHVRATAGLVDVDSGRRQLSGTLVRYGELGHTSAGELRVRPGAIHIPADLATVPLTEEHDRTSVRGHLVSVDDNGERLYVTAQVDDGPTGDQALAEAKGPKRVRAGLSYDIEDVHVDAEGWVTSARLTFVGQVEDPAHNSSRIDQVAASRNSGTSRANNEGAQMTPEQIARLAELLGNDARTPEEETELQTLVALLPAAEPVQAAAEDAPAADAAAAAEVQPVTASNVPAVPGGQPIAGQGAAKTKPQGGQLGAMIEKLTKAYQGKKTGGNVLSGVTAALQDVISTTHTENIEPLGWQGELFDGVDFTPVFSDLLTPGPLDNWEGQGYRVTSSPAMQDYAGDKAAIPSGNVTTEKELWEAARMAVGVDIDRKFFDFPNATFLAKVFHEVGLSYLELKDAKARAYVTTNAVKATKTITVTTANADATLTFVAGMITAADVGASITGAGIPGGATILSFTDATHAELSANATASATITATIDVQAPSLLKAAGRVALSLSRKGPDGTKAPSNSGAEYILVNDEDMFTLMDIDSDSVPAFLKLFKIDPENFRSDPSIPRGQVIGGVKKAAQLLTPAGNPIEVDALNLALGGVDKAFFAYWAILKNHKRGIQRTKFVPAG